MANDNEFEYWVRNNNPFAKTTSFQYSPDTQVAQNWGDALRGIDWENTQRKNRANLAAGFQFKPGQPFGSGSQTTQPTPANPFSLVKLSKDPSGRFDALNNQATSTISNFKPDYTDYRTQIQNFLNSNDANFNSDQASIRGNTNDLIDSYNRGKGALDEQTQQQVNNVGRYYADASDPNSIASMLKSQARQGFLAELRQGNRATNQAILRNNLRGEGGTSSYDAAIAGSIGAANRDKALENLAARNREDTRYVLNQQNQLLGKPQELEVANILRSKIPIEARQALIDSEARNIGNRLSNVGQAANLNQLTDALTTEGRRLGLTGQALRQYLDANFLEVQKQGDANYPLDIAYNTGRRFIPPPNYGAPYNSSPYNESPSGRSPVDRTTTEGTSPYGYLPRAKPGRSQAEEYYKSITGFYPDQDIRFDPTIWNDILDSKVPNDRWGFEPGKTPPWNTSEPSYSNPQGVPLDEYSSQYQV